MWSVVTNCTYLIPHLHILIDWRTFFHQHWFLTVRTFFTVAIAMPENPPFDPHTEPKAAYTEYSVNIEPWNSSFSFQIFPDNWEKSTKLALARGWCSKTWEFSHLWERVRETHFFFFALYLESMWSIWYFYIDLKACQVAQKLYYCKRGNFCVTFFPRFHAPSSKH